MFTLMLVPRLQGQTLPDALHHLPLKVIEQNSYLTIFGEGFRWYIIYLKVIYLFIYYGSIGFWMTLSTVIYLLAPTIGPIQS